MEDQEIAAGVLRNHESRKLGKEGKSESLGKAKRKGLGREVKEKRKMRGLDFVLGMAKM